MATVRPSICRGHPVGVDDGRDRVDRHGAQLHPEQPAGLVEGRVPGLRLDDVDAGQPPGRRVLAVGQHRVQDAAAAARRDQAARRGVGDGLGVEQVERHREDLALELRGAGTHVALEDVHVREQAERLGEEAVVLVVTGVHRPGALAGLPEGVLLGGHRPQLGEHLLPGRALLGQGAVHGEPVRVGKVGVRHLPPPPPRWTAVAGPDRAAGPGAADTRTSMRPAARSSDRAFPGLATSCSRSGGRHARRKAPRPWMMGPAPGAREEVAAVDDGDALHRAARRGRAPTASGSSTRPARPPGPTTGWPSCSGSSPSRMAGFRVEDALDARGPRALRATTSPRWRPGRGGRGQRRDRCSSAPTAARSGPWSAGAPSATATARRTGWLHRVTEYTDRKALVETLRDREQQLATAQSIAQIGSWSWDVPTDTVTWSDQLYRIYDLDPDEHDATYEGFLSGIHPDDRERVRAIVESTFADGRRVRLREPDHPARRRGAVDPWSRPRRARRGRHPAGRWAAPARTSPT